jgi:hypothetical protein
MAMTLLQLTDGKEIRVSQTYGEVRELLKEAIAAGVWLELHGDNGLVTGINPNNVSYIQNTTDEGPGPAVGDDWHTHRLTREGAAA